MGMEDNAVLSTPEPDSPRQRRAMESPPSRRTSNVVETDVADVQVNDSGVPEVVNEYKIMQLLGEGAFAKVFLCEKNVKDHVEQYVWKQ